MTTEKTQEEAAKLRQEKLMALEATLGNIEKSFGKGSIMRLGAEAEKMESISTGSIGLDYALGVGGLPKGRIIEIYGPESSGKTTLALHVVAEAQKMLSSSTPSQPLRPRAKSKARWATARWASKPA